MMPGMATPMLLKAGVAPTTWNPLDKAASITLNSGSLVSTNSSNGTGLVRATASKAAGKLYLEFRNLTVDSGGSIEIGLCNAGLTTSGNIAGAVAFRDNGTLFLGGSSAFSGTSWHDTTSIIGLAIDVPNKKIAVAVNNTWQNSANPAAGTGMTTWAFTGDPFVAMAFNGFGSPNSQSQVNFGAASFIYTSPSGYVAWG